jgi:AP-3 complex subunit sigma
MLFMVFMHSRLIYLVNTSGVARLTKFYTPLHQASHSLVQKIFSLISSRPAGLCNFLDAPELEAFLGPKNHEDERWRVVYRSYATLHFVFVVDGAESELGILDLIQVRAQRALIVVRLFLLSLGLCGIAGPSL